MRLKMAAPLSKPVVYTFDGEAYRKNLEVDVKALDSIDAFNPEKFVDDVKPSSTWRKGGSRELIFKQFVTEIRFHCTTQLEYTAVCDNLKRCLSNEQPQGYLTSTIRTLFEGLYPPKILIDKEIPSIQFRILEEVFNKLKYKNQPLKERVNEIVKTLKFINFLQENKGPIKMVIAQAPQKTELSIFELKVEILRHFSDPLASELVEILNKQNEAELGAFKPDPLYIEDRNSNTFLVYKTVVIPTKFKDFDEMVPACQFLEICLLKAQNIEGLKKQFSQMEWEKINPFEAAKLEKIKVLKLEKEQHAQTANDDKSHQESAEKNGCDERDKAIMVMINAQYNKYIKKKDKQIEKLKPCPPAAYWNEFKQAFIKALDDALEKLTKKEKK